MCRVQGHMPRTESGILSRYLEVGEAFPDVDVEEHQLTEKENGFTTGADEVCADFDIGRTKFNEHSF